MAAQTREVSHMFAHVTIATNFADKEVQQLFDSDQKPRKMLRRLQNSGRLAFRDKLRMYDLFQTIESFERAEPNSVDADNKFSALRKEFTDFMHKLKERETAVGDLISNKEPSLIDIGEEPNITEETYLNAKHNFKTGARYHPKFDQV